MRATGPALVATVCALVGAAGARADSGAISDLRPVSGDRVHATYTATSSTCVRPGVCGWFPYAVQVRGPHACTPDSLRLTFVGEFRRRSGTQTGADSFRPAWAAVRICLFVRDAAGANALVAQAAWPAGAAEPAPPEPPRPRGPQPLAVAEARTTVTRILERRFGSRFARRSGYERRCRRLSPTRVRCRVRWTSGAWDYAGAVTMRLDREDPDGSLAYSETVHRTRRG